MEDKQALAMEKESPVQQLNALVVDASAEFRDKAKKILESAGFSVELAENGQQGLLLANASRFRVSRCRQDERRGRAFGQAGSRRMKDL